ncbi:hypothetical protein GLV96_12410 [Staphylococcus agnetis]|uniref:hypothetical protein n=1 Tax=Staphylococcus agnetis TaxID=985762 RepID=UPI0014316563|nr:hypothetical protein [Staphylococcus agnetis]NJH87363.1 hypothetical protein [Staphylococcus agnetis]NJI15684.1 hypothetical protein [Staphylococcus agnetis]
MKKILFVLFASLLVLSACGNQGETEKASEKKPSKSTVEKKKENKEEKSTEEKQSSNTVEENQLSNTNTNNGGSESKTNSNTQGQSNINYNDPNTVVETYNGQTHVTTNNTVNEYYIPGETDPIYEREYKHFYTPEEAQRAQENSDAALREMGLEPERYE